MTDTKVTIQGLKQVKRHEDQSGRNILTEDRGIGQIDEFGRLIKVLIRKGQDCVSKPVNHAMIKGYHEICLPAHLAATVARDFSQRNPSHMEFVLTV